MSNGLPHCGIFLAKKLPNFYSIACFLTALHKLIVFDADLRIVC
jgi:hypothetical protein